MTRRYIATVLLLLFEANICVYSQNKNKGNSKEDDPIALVMQADSAIVKAQMTRKEKRAQRERRQVARLLRYFVEYNKFQFDAHFSYFRGHQNDAFGQSFRCYGGRCVNNLWLFRGDKGETSTTYFTNSIYDCTSFKIKNIHSDEVNDYLLLYDIIMYVPFLVDGHIYDQIKFEFVTNILNAKTSVHVTAGKNEKRECGIFTGYINTLR